MTRGARIAAATAAAMLLAALLWTATWFVVARLAEAGAQGWIEQERAAGARVSHRRLGVEGFPLRWTLVAEDYAIARPAPRPQSATGPRIEATISPLDLSRVVLRFPGRHRLEHGEFALELEAARPDAVLALRADGRVAGIREELGEATLRWPGAPGAARAARIVVDLHEIDPPDPATRAFLRFALALTDLAPPAGARPPFDRPLQGGEIELRVRGERAAAGTQAARIEAWRVSGGVVEMPRLRLDWSPVAMAGEGTATLDALNRPEAAMTLRIAGVPELLQALSRAGLVARQQATMLGALAAGMARTDPASGRQEVAVPVTAQNGRLMLGGIPVMALQPLELGPR
ncbi:MAG: DUF2125 domain-containing protein [Alphaproteobacteria bacterium]